MEPDETTDPESGIVTEASGTTAGDHAVVADGTQGGASTPVAHGGVTVYSTCPKSTDWDASSYLRAVSDAASWSEDAGCAGTLVYTDNSLIDPWVAASAILGVTTCLTPLVAVQPVYMHPYTAAKMVSSLAFLHGRSVDLNLLAGGFRNDLVALGDTTEHDDRYARTVEYALIVRGLLEDGGPVDFAGRYYRVHNLTLEPSLPPELLPRFVISGSSAAGMEAAGAIGATAIRYPQPASIEEEAAATLPPDLAVGIRVGIIARDTEARAWNVARERFPEDRQGQITHALAMKVSDSNWHRQLSEIEVERTPNDPYWLHPFRNYQTFCPYLVGTYRQVGDELARYFRASYRTVILDIPPSREELEHVGLALCEANRARA